jgi:hypothetical protein
MKRCLCLALFAAAATSLQAATVSWFNDQDDLLPMIQADGSYLDNSFSFAMGTFASGFDPLLNPYSTWRDNWRVLDIASAPAGNGWNSVDPGAPGHDVLDTLQPAYNNQYLDSQFSFNPDGSVQGLAGSSLFAAGETVFLWVYNTQFIGANTQWALLRDNTVDPNPEPTSAQWLLPAPSSPDALEIWSIEEADLALVGAVNHITNGISRGTGAHTDDLGGSFRLQTVVIPEPSSAFLVIASGLVLQLRRSRARRLSAL